ncbi:hypothetical protein ACN38_g12456, partial [Penicillium nordicum]
GLYTLLKPSEQRLILQQTSKLANSKHACLG